MLEDSFMRNEIYNLPQTLVLRALKDYSIIAQNRKVQRINNSIATKNTINIL